MGTLGQAIGITIDNFSVTNNVGMSTKIRVNIDYSKVSDIDIKSWLNGNRRIPLQRILRPMTTAEINALDGTTFMAETIGQKVKSDEQVKAEYMARFSSATPESQRQMIEDLEAQAQELMLQNARKNKELREVKTDEDDESEVE